MFSYLLLLCPFALSTDLPITVSGLTFEQGDTKVRTGNKLSNSRKTFRERTPRMTPNRLLAAVISVYYYTKCIKY